MSRINSRSSQGVPDTTLQSSLGHRLRRAYQKSCAQFVKAADSSDATPTQYAVLKGLTELGPTTQRALGAHVAMEPSNIHGMLLRMQKRGLVKIQADSKDKRRSVIKITAKGKNLADHIHSKVQEVDDQVLKSLTTSERAQFMDLLRKVADLAD